MDEKKEALAKYLSKEENSEVTADDIRETKYDSSTFEYGREEYLVLTDDEADERAAEYIKDSVWAFNPEFIIGHTDLGDDDYEAGIDIIKIIGEKCESGNRAMLALINDIDDFIEDAISADGRGHFLSGYDGEENEEGEYFIYRVN